MSESPRPVPEGARFPVLDGLRALAALIVVVHHVIKYFSTQSSVLQWIGDRNADAVLFFFVLSGYCIALAVRNTTPYPADAALNFLKRRAFRLLPSYWLALGISAFVAILMAEPLSFIELVGNLLMLQSIPNGWFTPFASNGPLWSLAYEAFFYGVFPLLWWFNRRLPRGRWLLKFLALFAASLASIALQKAFFTPWAAYFSLLPIWIAGYFAARALTEHDQHSFFIGLTALAICLLLIVQWKASATLESLARGLLFAVAMHAAAAHARIATGWVQRVYRFGEQMLSWRALTFIGGGSYLLYVVHYPIVRYLHAVQAPLWQAYAAMAFLVIVCGWFEPKLVRWTRPRPARTA